MFAGLEEVMIENEGAEKAHLPLLLRMSAVMDSA
jgi:hypothetical protein